MPIPICEYNFHFHVASDIVLDTYYLHPHSFNTKNFLNKINEWTQDNLIALNGDKSKYIIFNRAQADFNTRLTLEGNSLEQIHQVRLLGVVLTDDLKWEANTQDIYKGAFARISMITKLKYVGVFTQVLIDVYILIVHSLLEYCSVVWHSSLTVEQSSNIERV